MAKYKTIDCELYKKEVTVFLGNYNDMLKWTKREFVNPEYKPFLDGLEEARQGEADTHYYLSCCIVRLEKFPKAPQEISVAAHEILHAAMFILDNSGVEYVPDSNNEAFTYLVEWLTKKVFDNEGYKNV